MRQVFQYDNSQIYNAVRAEQERVKNYQLKADPSVADRLGRAYTAYNWVNPGIIAATVLSGNDALLPQIGEVVGKQAWKAGVSPTDSRPGVMTPQERLAIQERLRAIPVQNSRYTPPKKKEEGGPGWWGRLPGYSIAATIGDFVTPEALEDVIGTVRGSAYEGLKGFSRGFMAGASYGPQVIQNEIFALANYLPSGHSYQTQRDKSLFDQFIRGPLYEETYLGQIVNQAGRVITTPERDLGGRGFSVGGRVAEEQAKAAGEYRPLIGENKTPMTVGRAGAMSLADIGIIQEGSATYNVLSGLIDAAVTIKVDPTFDPEAVARVIKSPFGSAGRAATAIPEKDAVRAAAGLVEGERPTLNPTLWNSWRDSAEAVKVFDPYVKEKNPAAIWRMMKRQGIMTAKDIATADDHNGVISAIDNAVNNLDPAYHMREVPSGNFNTLSDVGYRIKQSGQRYTRLFEVMPESLYIPKNDIEVASRRVDDLMGYLGFDIDTRNTWVNKLIDAHGQGSKGFFNYFGEWEDEVLGRALAANGVPKEEVAQLTRWRQYTVDRTARFTLQDMGDGAPAAWMERGNIGPLRNTQLLQDGAYLVDPSELENVVYRLGKLYKLEQQANAMTQTGSIALRGTGKIIKGGLKTADVLDAAYGSFQTQLWKPIVVTSGRYLTRVLPDEQLRVLLNGTFEHPMDYVSAMMDGRLGAKLGVGGTYVDDVFGTSINKATLLADTENQIAEISRLKEEINALRKTGDVAGAAALANRYKPEIDKLDDLLALQEKTAAALDANQPGLHQALIARTPSAAKNRLMGTYNDGTMMRTKAVDIANRTVAKERNMWVNGVVQEAADLYNNPHIRRVANGGLFDNDVVTLGGVTSKWGDHLRSGRGGVDAGEAVAQWLFNGSGREYFTRYFENYAGLPVDYQWDNIENAREFTRVLTQEVKSVAGSNSKILDAIATGAFEGETAFTRSGTNVAKASDKFRTFVAKTFIDDASAPVMMRYRPDRAYLGSRFNRTAAISDGWSHLLGTFYGQLYGIPSDKLSRSPAFRAAYWGRIEEVAPILSKDAAAELSTTLENVNLPATQKERITRLLKLANGENDLESADMAAKSFALGYTRNLLFDSTKKSWVGDHYRYLFPFFEAYREQGTTWAKLLIERPQNAHKIDVALRGLRGLALEDYNGDGKKDMFLAKDPTTGEEMVTIPGTGWLGQHFSGVPTQGLKLPTGSMTMFTNVLPGIGPAVQFPLQYFIPTTKNWQWVNDIAFPYGRPEETGQEPIAGFAGLAVPRPTWLKRVSPYLSQKAKELPVVGGTLGQMVGKFIEEVGGNEQESQVYRAYYANTLKTMASISPVPKTQRDMEDFLANVEDNTNKLYFLRGLGNFFAPGTPITKFMAQTKGGDVEIGVLADKLREYEKQAEDAGQDRSIGTMNFLNTYGEAAWGVMTSVRKSTKYEGIVMSKDFEDWFDGNRTLIKTYPQVASYFGPRDAPEKFGPTEMGVYNRFITKGALTVQTGEEQIAQAQSRIANTVFQSMKSQLTAAQQNTAQGKAMIKMWADTIKKEFPKWDRALAGAESESKRAEQLRQLAEIATDKKVASTDMGKAVKAYLAFRDQKIAEMKSVGVTGWYTASPKTTTVRQQLTTLGEGLSEALPGFKDLWTDVLSKEFKPVEEDNG